MQQLDNIFTTDAQIGEKLCGFELIFKGLFNEKSCAIPTPQRQNFWSL